MRLCQASEEQALCVREACHREAPLIPRALCSAPTCACSYEMEHGLLQPSTSIYSKGPDRKTVERIVNRMEETGGVKRADIILPGSYSNGEPRSVSSRRRSLHWVGCTPRGRTPFAAD